MSKPILVLVNPKSGRGRSVKTLETLVVPMLKSRNLPYEIHITEAHFSVRDILNETNQSNLQRFKSLLIVSGDGLLHDVVNTIMARSDWQDAIKIPLGIVPTGSGNGLAYTLVRMQQPRMVAGQEALKLCCQQALQDETCASDLVKIKYGQNTIIWSFLSIGWGLLSDIDVDSDWLRAIGELRFTLYGILRSCTAVSYRGKLSYLPKKSTPASNSSTTKANDNHDQSKTDNNEDNQDWIHIDDTFACLYAVYQSYISSSTRFAPKSTLTDKTVYLTYVRGSLSILRSLKFLLAIGDGAHDQLPFVTVVPVERFKFQPLEESKIVVDGDVIPWKLDDGQLTVEIVPKVMNLAWTQTLSDTMAPTKKTINQFQQDYSH